MIFVDFLQKSGVFCRFCRRKFFGRYACGNPIKTAPFSLILCVPYGTSTPRTAAYRAICSTRISSTRSTLSTKSTHRSRALRQVTLARLAVCEARPLLRPSLVILYARRSAPHDRESRLSFRFLFLLVPFPFSTVEMKHYSLLVCKFLRFFFNIMRFSCLFSFLIYLCHGHSQALFHVKQYRVIHIFRMLPLVSGHNFASLHASVYTIFSIFMQ